MAKSKPRSTAAPRPEFTSVVRVSPTQEIRRQLLEAIRRGDYQPGDPIPSERELCETFNVSRVSVREAIAGLEALGVVSVQQGRGCFVTKTVGDRFVGPFGEWLDTYHDQLLELLNVRKALDELAAHEAARHADAETLDELRRVHERFRGAVSGDSPPDLELLAELDVAFHSAVSRASGSKLLHNLLTELAGHIADSRRITFAREGQPMRSFNEHAAILAAVLDGDAERAKRSAGNHVLSAWRTEEGEG
jgi:GntR family transcriptional regulator, transcriptional repressor for pyruvate dehydrogenase complex